MIEGKYREKEKKKKKNQTRKKKQTNMATSDFAKLQVSSFSLIIYA